MKKKARRFFAIRRANYTHRRKGVFNPESIEDLEVSGNVRCRTDAVPRRPVRVPKHTLKNVKQPANEELQAANEELMLTQEELQATNEELEATNEELQATNEELETNNEELQATNEELQTTNDELTARTTELQELAKQRRLEQLQLSLVFERFPHYVMILNAKDLTVQAFNPAYKQLLGDRDVQGLSIAELFSDHDIDDLIKALRTAIRKRESISTTAMRANISGEHESEEAVSSHHSAHYR